MIEQIYIWKTPKDKYYYKVVKGYYKYNTVGDVNQYGHTLILKIDLNYFMSTKRCKVDYSKMLINDIIRFLENIKKERR